MVLDKVEFLKSIEMSANELKSIVKEAHTLHGQQEYLLKQANKHLRHLYKMMDVMVNNMAETK